MDITALSVPITVAIIAGSAILGGVITGLSAWFALRGRMDLHDQRITLLENAENTALELRISSVEDKLRLEKFEEFWNWRATVNNRLDALEKNR